MSSGMLDELHGLSEHHVGAVEGERAGVRLTPKTGAAFIKMREAALKDGLELHVASGFRDFARQNLIYTGKFDGVRQVLDRNEEPLDISHMSEEEKVRAILYFSAIPGLSRHHYGTDIDVFAANLLAPGEELDLTNRLYGTGNQRPLTKWLEKYMADFGFFRPYVHDGLTASELWHISYAPEADVYTKMLTLAEAVSFVEAHNLRGARALTDILKAEFTSRFKILSGR